VSTPDPQEKRRTIGTKSRKVACVATLTAAGLSFALVPSTGASSQKSPKAPSARTGQTAKQDREES